MATTTNYSWSTPDDTALVKDGAAAIRTLGSSADTTVKALNPGTTAGDIDYYTTSTAKARIGIGTANQVLRVNSGATAPEWATVSSGGMTLLSTTSLSGATTDITNIDQTYTELRVYIYGVTNATANGVFFATPRNSTTSLTVAAVALVGDPSTANPIGNAAGARLSSDAASLILDRTNADNFWSLTIRNYASTTTHKSYEVAGGFYETGDTRQEGWFVMGQVASTSAVNGLRFSNSGGNLSTGTVLLYGVK
jgi:hypothetical protein